MEKLFVQRLGKSAEKLAMTEAYFATAEIGYQAAIVRPEGNYHIVKTSRGYQITYQGIVTRAASVTEGIRVATKTIDAYNTLKEKVRAYPVKNGRIALHVWTKDMGRLDVLKEIVGGNYYRHGSGFLWVCSKRDEIVAIADVIRESLETNEVFQMFMEVQNESD